MKRVVLHLLLLLGALIGLFGQAATIAAAPLHHAAPPAMSGMSAACLKMMAMQQPTPKSSKSAIPECCAPLGAVPIVLGEAPLLPQMFVPVAIAAFWPAATVLHGSELTPEPEPPTLLG